MSGPRSGHYRTLGLMTAALLPSLLASGCATLGGNVRGSFACQTPEGICAPSTTIDDRALAMISAETVDGAVPAGPYQRSAERMRPGHDMASAPASPTASMTDARRTGEKVLRIVFRPYVDGYGRLHEASAVRAIVQGEWEPTAAATLASGAPAQPSLLEALDDAGASVALASNDPDLPDPAAVAAARARKVDPVGAIRADVAARLAGAGRQAGPSASPRRLLDTSPPGSTPRATSSAARQPAPITGDRAPGGQTSSAVTPLAAATAARVRSDSRMLGVAQAARTTARDAADAPPIAPVVRAAAFPGVSLEDR